MAAKPEHNSKQGMERYLLGGLSQQVLYILFLNSIQPQSILNVLCGRGP